MTVSTVEAAVLSLQQPERVASVSRYFKTHPGQYGEGDVFLGLSMPQQHTIARQFSQLSVTETERLVQHTYHECRMVGLLIWAIQSKRGSSLLRQKLTDRYVANRHFVNNWDLVDSSCPTLMGLPLLTADRSILYELAAQEHLWSQRMSIVTTLAFIRKGQFHDTFALAELLLNHPHNLIHKAIGWMLREIGKRNRHALDEFLHDHIRQLPRTSLRYAIERHEPTQRKALLTL